MARFVVDARRTLAMLADEVPVAAGHRPMAPTLLRFQVLDAFRSPVPARCARTPDGAT